MANWIEIAVLLSVGVSGWFFQGWAARCAETHLDMLLTGVVDGIPMSLEHRRDKLFNRYIQWVGAIVASSTILAATVLILTGKLSDPSLRPIGYLWAFGTTWPGATWLVVGTSSALKCAKSLRQAEKDSR